MKKGLELYVSRVELLKPEEAGRGFVRVPRHLIDGSKKKRDSHFFRRDLVVIMNRFTGASVMRIVYGNSGYNLSESAIAMDYDTLDALGARVSDSMGLLVSRPTFFERVRHFWNTDDPVARFGNRAAILAVTLGILGVIEAAIPFVFHVG